MKDEKIRESNLLKKKLVRKIFFSKKVLFILFTFCIISCQSEFDKYYEKPSWLDDNAYDVLKEKGNFNNYLKLADRTLYSKILHGSGSYTFFAPNDEAFTSYLKSNNYNSVDDIPLKLASEIISYSMVYNQYSSINLGDSWESSAQWNSGSSVRKKTPSYKGIYKDLVNGDSVYVYDEYSTTFSEKNNDNRYLYIFTPAYFYANELTSSDYKYFYDTEWSDKANVFDAKIINSDIYVSNGVVHETDKVIEVPKNIDEMIMQYAEDPNRTTEGWKRFKDLIYHKYEDGTYQFITYAEEKEAATYYKKVYPELESQLSKVYSRKYNSSTLNVLPNIEYFVRSANEGGTPETYAYTIFMPEDKAIEDYFKNTILKYTSNINNLPSLVLNTFLGSHFSRSLVWPGKYKTAKNITGAEGEFFNGAGVNGPSFEDAEIISSQFASNGIVYRTKKVIKSGLFESVYGRILLDPEYSFIYLLLGDGTLYEKLTTSSYTGYSGDSYNYTLVIPSNTLLKSDGFSYNSQSSAFQNSENTNIDAYARLSRLVNSGIFIREVNGDNKPDILNDFSSQPPALNGAYDGYGYLVNNYGDIIRYKNNQLQAIGNIEDGTFVTIEKDPYTYCNGQIYTIDRLLNYSPRETLGGTDEGWNQKTVESFLSEYLNSHSDASVFKAYYNQCNGEIEFNSSSFYTLLIPTNERMNEAIELGYLPTLSDVSTNSNGELLKAVAFLNSHLIVGSVYVDDGMKRIYPGNYEYFSMSTSNKITEAKLDLVFAKTYASVKKTGNENLLTFKASDIESGKNSVVIGYNSIQGTNTVIRNFDDSNIIGPRSVIHKLDGFLYYNVNENLLK